MSRTNYRDVRGAPTQIKKLSELINDLDLMSRLEIVQMVLASRSTMVTSVNGQLGDVILTIPNEQEPSDWNASEGVTQILNKPTIPDAQVPSDWSASSGVSRILNKPTIPTVKRLECFFGTTNASGVYSVTYSTPYSAIPDVQPQLTAGTPSQVVRITSSTTTGFSVSVTNRASANVLGIELLLAATTAVSGAALSVQVTER